MIWLNVYHRTGIPERMAEPCEEADLEWTLKKMNNLSSDASLKWAVPSGNFTPEHIIEVFASEQEAQKSFWRKSEWYFEQKRITDLSCPKCGLFIEDAPAKGNFCCPNCNVTLIMINPWLIGLPYLT